MAITAPRHTVITAPVSRERGGTSADMGVSTSWPIQGQDQATSAPSLFPVGGQGLEGPPVGRALTLVIQMERHPGGGRACPWPRLEQKQTPGWNQSC